LGRAADVTVTGVTRTMSWNWHGMLPAQLVDA
jgi:hypothetical protein